jgi:ParB-like chromosome segregation protein Spo0J
MSSRELEAGELSVAQPGGPPPDAPSASVPGPASTDAGRTSSAQRLEIAQIDLRFSRLRLPSPQQRRRLQASIQSEGRIREPLLASTGVEEKSPVLVDGFKRLCVAQELGLTYVWVRTVQLDAAHAKAAILQYNQAREGLSEIEEAWIVHSLCKDHGMTQAEVARLLQRTQSWVSRRNSLVETLEERLQEDVRLGLLSVSMARELSLMPRGIQLQAAQAVSDYQLSSRQSALLVKRLREASDPQAMRAMLGDPLRYLASDVTKSATTGGNDPRLSEAGNQLRQALLGWQDSCGRLARELRSCHPAATEAHVLLPVLQQTLQAGKRVVKQLGAIHKTCSEQPPAPAPQSEPKPAQGAADA